MEYLVDWTIDIEADSPTQAAIEARKRQIAPGTHAVVFDVHTEDGPVRVDLLELQETTEYLESGVLRLDPRELATVLFALRKHQEGMKNSESEVLSVLTGVSQFADVVTPLTVAEIDHLCERLNFD